MFIFYAHGGSDNHGCEAIVRGTCQNLKGEKTIYSSNAKSDKMYGLDKLCTVIPDTYKRYYHPVKWAFGRLFNILFKKNTVFKLINGNKKGVYLSVGGDNYCYPRLINPILEANKRIREKNNTTILWGTSIENEVLDQRKVLEDISLYKYIFARESLTYENLIKHGLEEKTFLYPDPAFAMKPQKTNVLKSIFNKEVIGINISPLILKFEDEESQIKKGYESIIEFILKNTEANILLVPHVVKRNNDDRVAINKIKEKFKNNRIFVLDDMAAHKLKFVISKCSFFVGARTHSTIAAYSSCVPTLVIGYSIKARGIAKDIFGTYDDYVVDVRTLKNYKVLLETFKKLYLNKIKIKKHLEEFMPKYIMQTEEAAKKLYELINK